MEMKIGRRYPMKMELVMEVMEFNESMEMEIMEIE